MAWFVLVVAGLLEVVWATALKHTDGFTRLWPSLLAVASAALSFFMLAWAMKALPVGAAYAVWVGIGAVGVVIAGIVTMQEDAGPARLLFLALIVVGIIGLRLVEH
ncbi:quaternary ammonium compound efflux SMR transporter SugE [Verrucosispora sp. WMMA2044]|uniref:Quaternary ammonium compound efflux SMR transporter SugE n=1 Tax=Verrucosispora sioxanthis TaxID=2499994 RepID=A0A6M1L3F7_9ACTN|nr:MULTISPECIES: quaternary ammonium compound efflux SMR transporter SugE [Micromonospora]NEE64147.1 quaternary ammonium compound efflux SMR transporter SugE [Verrucosispora sioxanthis]NGM13257.1 quaternary ammonium compound efflux SMR transporter SugE [Verrucosispora sioxanthis]WBB51217.1 quaternary ammonium compound efflux SMR transporter SugE [Verrucosispora sp. WMMA2044]